MSQLKLKLECQDKRGITHQFALQKPLSISRELHPNDPSENSNAFDLPSLSAETFAVDGFVGDVQQGGSCNVDVLSYCPHGMTHIETSAHVLADGPMINAIPNNRFSGLAYIADLSHLGQKGLIAEETVRPILDSIDLPINVFLIKTASSLLPASTDFQGRDFIALSPETARALNRHNTNGQILALLTDLPSLDPETNPDLPAHRAFFGIPAKGFEGKDEELRVVVELAYLPHLSQGYYYACFPPPRVESNATKTDVLLFPLEEC